VHVKATLRSAAEFVIDWLCVGVLGVLAIIVGALLVVVGFGPPALIVAAIVMIVRHVSG